MAILKISTTKLLDTLTAALLVEKTGVELYSRAPQYIPDPVVRSRLQEFRNQTMRHQEVLENLIRGYGGDSSQITPMGLAVQAQSRCLLDFDEISKAGPAAVLGSIHIAELKDRADWQFLDRLAHETGDSKMIQAAQEVLPQEEGHVAYITQTMSELLRKEIMPTSI